MRASIEQAPHTKPAGMFSSKPKPTGLQCIKLAVQITEEEKHIIKQAGMSDDVFFVHHNVHSGRENPLSYKFWLVSLFDGGEHQFLPKEQNTASLMELEQDLENAVRSLKARLEEVVNRPVGKRTIDL